MAKPDPDFNQDERPDVRISTTLLMTGLVAMVFEGETAWTMLIRAVVKLPKDVLIEGPWSHLMLLCFILALVVTLFSMMSFAGRFWRGIVWSCLGWLLIVGLASVLIIGAPHATGTN